jgi:hypothetical protein
MTLQCRDQLLGDARPGTWTNDGFLSRGSQVRVLPGALGRPDAGFCKVLQIRRIARSFDERRTCDRRRRSASPAEFVVSFWSHQRATILMGSSMTTGATRNVAATRRVHDTGRRRRDLKLNHLRAVAITSIAIVPVFVAMRSILLYK